MKNLISAQILLIAILLFNCANMKTKNPDPTSCFNTENFAKAREIINFRISVSGMGKFYITFPKEENRVNDGVKRLPKNPDDVFDVFTDMNSKIITMKSPKHSFQFEETTGLQDQGKVEAGLANELFCYLLKIKN